MKSGYLDVPDGRIHYRATGSGDPLLLLPPNASSSEAFSQVMALLAGRCYAVALDFPGYGGSPPPAEPYRDIVDYALSAFHVLDALGIQRASVIGDHTGATVAVEMAASSPGRVDRLVLFGCPYWKDEAARLKAQQGPLFRPTEVQGDGSHIANVWAHYERQLQGAPPEDIQRAVVDALLSQLSPCRGQEAHYALLRYDTPARLPMVQSPTLVLTAPGDGFFRWAGEVEERLPRAKVQVIPDTNGHASRLRPREFADAVVEFLNDPGV